LDIRLGRTGDTLCFTARKYGLIDNSPNMLPKQIEMDGIVKDIYQAIESEAHLESALFVLCGDHGMNDGGNHGGSAPGETSPALVFMSPKLKTITNGTKCPTIPTQDFDYYTKIEQSDIAPTLAGLLGFPIPLNNLGVFIPEFLSFWSTGSFNQLVHDTKIWSAIADSSNL
jgi:ethanolamine phosphate transferase 2 subunit G